MEAHRSELSFVLQVGDSCTEGGKSRASRTEMLSCDSLYQIYAEELVVLFSALLGLLKKNCSSEQNKIFINSLVEDIEQHKFPLFYKTHIKFRNDEILVVLQNMIGALLDLNSSRLSFSTESEMISIFQIVFNEQMFRSEVFCMTCSYLYKSLREAKSFENATLIKYSMFVKLFLLQHNLKVASCDLLDYPIHQAIYENSVTDLIEILHKGNTSNYFYLGLEDCDNAGNTPLLLAVKLQNIGAIVVLLEYSASPTNRPTHHSLCPIEEAANIRNTEILKLLLRAEYRNRQYQFQQSRTELKSTLKAIPDFSMVLSWSCESPIIPFLHSVVPPQSYTIMKGRNNLRIDMGSKSILYTGDSEDMWTYDHEAKTVQEIVSEVEIENLESAAKALQQKFEFTVIGKKKVNSSQL